jgi:hypothetical protein
LGQYSIINEGSFNKWETSDMRLRAPVSILALVTALLLPGTPVFAHPDRDRLPLGPAGLPETRTETVLGPGLVLTTITRGRLDPAKDFWTIGVNLPIGDVPPDPDPDADQGALGSKEKADAVAAQLRARGFTPRVEPVDWAPRLTGYPGGLIGYTVRIGRYPVKPTSADPTWQSLVAAGFSVAAVHTGQDGRPDNTGPWVVRVLRVDPHRFPGKVASTVGGAVSGQEAVTAMARATGAVFAVNGGYFVINPADGTPGVPAGLSVLDGTPVTAATNGRAALVLGDGGRRTSVEALWSKYSVRFGRGSSGGGAHLVDGLNRPPGVIRDCGGTGGDRPTSRPVHDFTCSDPNETVVLTARYGAPPPAGAGVEAVVGADGKVLQVRPRTGAAAPAGASVVQAIGTDAAWLTANAVAGATMRLDTTVTDRTGRPVRFQHGDSVVNGGPQLVHNGQISVDPVRDGLVHDDPALHLPPSALGASWGYTWFIRDNPRTGAGVDDHGRLLLVEVDGRQPGVSQGLPIKQFADVLRSLGAVEAINLDGGGSSAVVVNGALVSSPSDVDGQGNPVERKTAEAIVVTR